LIGTVKSGTQQNSGMGSGTAVHNIPRQETNVGFTGGLPPSPWRPLPFLGTCRVSVIRMCVIGCIISYQISKTAQLPLHLLFSGSFAPNCNQGLPDPVYPTLLKILNPSPHDRERN